ncbi:MAG: BamA/TamA family outer membrane protein, partial [Gemmatimonadaceae bacterium]
KQGFGIYGLPAERALGTPVVPASSGVAGMLPPADAFVTSVVGQYLADATTGLPVDGNFNVSPYKSSLGLAAIGQPTVGVAASTSGTMVGGGTSLYFTDILGNRNLVLGVQANGTFKDIGGEVQYFNLARRLIWGAGLARIPYVSGFARVSPVDVGIGGGQSINGQLIEQFTQRMYVDQASLLSQYPFSTIRRAELNLSVTRLSFNTEVEQIVVANNQVIDRNKFDTTSAPSVNYAQAALAYVGDNSFFGFTAPITGWRYRFEASPTFGSLQFQTALADMRRYFFAKPFTLAIRGLHFGRYGKDAESPSVSPVFAGDPTIVRGYSPDTFTPDECSVDPVNPRACPEFDRLIGSRLVAAGLELRIPLFGSDQLGLIRSPLFPIDIAPFIDGALAWSRGDSPSIQFARESSERIPVFSAGVSARANLFGYAVLEVFYAKPFQRPQKDWVLGFQLAPGW